MKGRPPKPAKAKELDGNPGKRKLPEEPRAPIGAPPMPDHLDEYGKKVWHKVVGELELMGTLSRVDGELLEFYAQTKGDYLRCRDLVARTGLVLDTPDDDGNPQMKRNPAAVELHKYRDAAQKYLVELGLTPVARARIGLANLEHEEELVLELIA